MQAATVGSDLTAFDWVLVGVLVLSTVAGLGRGLIRTLASLGGWFVGLLLACWYYRPLALHLREWITSFTVCEVIGFLLVFLGTKFVFSAVAAILRKAMKAVGLGFVDRLLGGVFGAMRGVVLGVGVMIVVTAFIPETRLEKDSMLTPYFLRGFHELSFVVPVHLRDAVYAGTRETLQLGSGLLRSVR